MLSIKPLNHQSGSQSDGGYIIGYRYRLINSWHWHNFDF